MTCIRRFQYILFNITLLQSLLIVCAFGQLRQIVIKLDKYEGDVCGKGSILDSDYVCTRANNCKSFAQSIKDGNYPAICSFNGSQPIVCCQEKNATNSRITNIKTADEMCLQLFLGQGAIPAIVGGLTARLDEFPHMALLGFGNTTEGEYWGCGGSLISDRWILTAAHCQKVGFGDTARWARLGVSNYKTKKDDPRIHDYRIVEHVIHPDYEPTSVYNDIALFRLETEVKFSESIKPICLNSDPLLNPEAQIATGWGQIFTGGPTSADLLKVDLNVIPANQCNASYFSNNDPKLKFGIKADSMICAGSVDGKKDTCWGDSGGPLQAVSKKYPGMFTQFGITSFGKNCGDKDAPGVYTRVSKYITWIEKIAFHKI